MDSCLPSCRPACPPARLSFRRAQSLPAPAVLIGIPRTMFRKPAFRPEHCLKPRPTDLLERFPWPLHQRCPEAGRGWTVMLPLSGSTVTRAQSSSSFTARNTLRRSVSLNLRGFRLVTHLSDNHRVPRAGHLRNVCPRSGVVELRGFAAEGAYSASLLVAARARALGLGAEAAILAGLELCEQ